MIIMINIIFKVIITITIIRVIFKVIIIEKLEFTTTTIKIKETFAWSVKIVKIAEITNIVNNWINFPLLQKRQLRTKRLEIVRTSVNNYKTIKNSWNLMDLKAYLLQVVF